MTYYIRTIPNICSILKPLDKKIQTEFIPEITEGHHCTPTERPLLCDTEYKNSKLATKQLTKNINKQILEYEIDREQEKKIGQTIKKERKERHEKLLEEVRKSITKEELLANDIRQMKGASAWLNALPLEAEDYALNKREFFNAILANNANLDTGGI